WARAAISGTTPPYGRCASFWPTTAWARIWRSLVTRAAALSSHEDSRPRIKLTAKPFASSPRRRLVRRCGEVPQAGYARLAAGAGAGAHGRRRARGRAPLARWPRRDRTDDDQR